MAFNASNLADVRDFLTKTVFQLDGKGNGEAQRIVQMSSHLQNGLKAFFNGPGQGKSISESQLRGIAEDYMRQMSKGDATAQNVVSDQYVADQFQNAVYTQSAPAPTPSASAPASAPIQPKQDSQSTANSTSTPNGASSGTARQKGALSVGNGDQPSSQRPPQQNASQSGSVQPAPAAPALPKVSWVQRNFATSIQGVKENLTGPEASTGKIVMRGAGVAVGLGVSWHFLRKAAKGTKIDAETGQEMPQSFVQRTGNAIAGLAGIAVAAASAAYRTR